MKKMTVSYDIVFDKDEPYKMDAAKLNKYMKKNKMLGRGVTVVGFGPLSQTHSVTLEGTRNALFNHLVNKLELDADQADQALIDGEVEW